MNKKFIGVIAASILFAACGQHGEQAAKADILKADLDTTVSPAEDFFDYANGGWMKKNPIPADETSWGIAQLVQQELYNRLLHINEDAAGKHAKSGVTQQIGDFWATAMDTVAIEKAGIEPLKAELAKINALQTPKDVMTQAVHMHTYGVGVFFDEGVSQDSKNSDAEAYYMTQGGIGLPNRDYYFNTDPRTTKIREAYPHYVATMFKLMGVDSNEANKKAAAVVALEAKLAGASRKLEALRDPYANYNKMAISALPKLSPNIDWSTYLKEIGVAHVDSVIIGQPEFYKELDKVISSENIQTLKDYMAFDLVRTFAPYMSKPFVDANFEFYSGIIRGAKQQRPRWKRVLDAEEHAMGEALGQLFAKEYFNEKAKKRYEDIVENVRSAYKARMEKLTWMSDSTKQRAYVKLATLKKKVGYPDKWK
ncbi:MAG: M13 family metallopeptidase, partial [Flavipsychrobacter sp.]